MEIYYNKTELGNEDGVKNLDPDVKNALFSALYLDGTYNSKNPDDGKGAWFQDDDQDFRPVLPITQILELDTNATVDTSHTPFLKAIIMDDAGITAGSKDDDGGSARQLTVTDVSHPGANIFVAMGNADDKVTLLDSGNDTVYAGTGNDFIDASGNTGKDSIWGGSGHDTLIGGAGSQLHSGSVSGGYNILQGQGGTDTLYGGGGADSLYGSGGNDSLVAGPAAVSWCRASGCTASCCRPVVATIRWLPGPAAARRCRAAAAMIASPIIPCRIPRRHTTPSSAVAATTPSLVSKATTSRRPGPKVRSSGFTAPLARVRRSRVAMATIRSTLKQTMAATPLPAAAATTLSISIDRLTTSPEQPMIRTRA